jgi:hypothetical protein
MEDAKGVLKEIKGIYVALYQDEEKLMKYLNALSSHIEKNTEHFSEDINSRMQDLARRIDTLELLIDD